MSRMLPLLLCATLPLSACTSTSQAPAAESTAAAASVTPSAASGDAPAKPAPPPSPVADAPQPQPAGASISGAIRDGNRAPPALRICAHPLGGGVPTCTDSPAGATEYRIDVAPGRYYLMGWVRGGELQLIAHASQIRCIRAPCPPDALIEVVVAAGDARTGIDLSGGYVDVPAGWPARP